MTPKQTPGMNGAKLTKVQRAEQRQEKARILREQEAKRRLRNRVLMIVACVVVLAVVVFAVVKIIAASNAAKNGDPGSYRAAAKPAVLANVGDDFGITVDTNGAAAARDSSLPQVDIYSNATCPHCMQLESAVDPAVNKYMKAGTVQFTFYPLATDPVGCEPQSVWATTADFYIATYAPEQFAAFHEQVMNAKDGVYAQIPEKTQAGQTIKGYCKATDPVQPRDLAEFAKRVGVPSDVVNSLPAAVTSAEWQKVAESATQAFLANEKVCLSDQCGTPTVTLNGRIVDSTEYGGNNSAAFEAWLEKVATGKVR